MLPGAFSGTLLEEDLRGAVAPPAFLGEAAGAGAAADPAAFLVGGHDVAVYGAASGLLHSGMPAFASGGAATRAHSLEAPCGMGGMGGGSRASASDLLRALESGCDFLLPSEPLDMPISLLGGPGDCSSPPPMATSPGTPPSVPGALSWPSLIFPPIPEEAELLQAAPASAPTPLLPPASQPPSLQGSMAATATAAGTPLGSSPFTMQPAQMAAPSQLPLFVPVPAAAIPLAQRPPAPPAPLPAPPSLALSLSG